MKKLLIVTTNYSGCKDDSENCIKETGVYLEEFAIPYLIFEKSNIDMTLASPKGGLSPIDETSMSCSNPMEWDRCIKILRDTKKLNTINLEEFDGVYFPGGHGPMFDLTDNPDVIKTVEYFFKEGKLVSAICHGVCALIDAKHGAFPLIKGRRLTSFTDEEERIVKKKELVPFLLETKLRELGAIFEAEKPWAEHVVADKNLITGQNQNSAALIAEKMIEFLKPSP